MKITKAAAYIVSKLMVPSISRRRKYNKNIITVLSLHRVSNEHSLCWPPMPLLVFERLCQYWSQYYHVTTFEALESARSVNKKPLLVLSFDDGYLDFYSYAWPILKKYNLKANMNIVTRCASEGVNIWTQRLNNAFDALAAKGVAKSLVLDNGYFIKKDSTKAALVKANRDLFNYLRLLEAGERDCLLNDIIKQFGVEEIKTRMMDWAQVAEVNREGVEIGSHTSSHDILTSIKNQDILEHEIVHSKQLLEEKLGREVRILAFPNGYYNQDVLTTAAKAGYQVMLTVNDALLEELPTQANAVVPRILLHHPGYYENQLNTENLFKKLKSSFK